MTKRACTAIVVLVALALAGACGDPQPEAALSTPDQAVFADRIYPLLVRDCGFHACHGSHERFFQVFGPGHGRLYPGVTAPLDEATEAEITHSLGRALSMIDPEDPAQSLLLRKPLAGGAGGAGHEGVDRRGRDVYEARSDPNYTILEQWVMTAQQAQSMLR